MKQCNNVTMKSGFTMMEAIVAIFVITTGLVGILNLVTQTISSATISKDKLVAAYLAQEGIEIVRNIRDRNWLQEVTWNYGLVPPAIDCSIGCQADYDDKALSTPTDPTGDPLNIDDVTGYFGYGTGTPTKFIRKITISDGPIVGESLNVKVEVSWQEKGKLHKVEAQENLYNWH